MSANCFSFWGLIRPWIPLGDFRAPDSLSHSPLNENSWHRATVYYTLLQRAAKVSGCICYGISVCLSVRLSVTLRYCVKNRKRRGMWSSPSGSPVLLDFWRQEWLMGDDPVQVKSECKEVAPLKTVELYTFRLISNSGTVIESEKSSIKANRKSTMSFLKVMRHL